MPESTAGATATAPEGARTAESAGQPAEAIPSWDFGSAFGLTEPPASNTDPTPSAEAAAQPPSEESASVEAAEASNPDAQAAEPTTDQPTTAAGRRAAAAAADKARIAELEAKAAEAEAKAAELERRLSGQPTPEELHAQAVAEEIGAEDEVAQLRAEVDTLTRQYQDQSARGLSGDFDQGDLALATKKDLDAKAAKLAGYDRARATLAARQQYALTTVLAAMAQEAGPVIEKLGLDPEVVRSQRIAGLLQHAAERTEARVRADLEPQLAERDERIEELEAELSDLRTKAAANGHQPARGGLSAPVTSNGHPTWDPTRSPSENLAAAFGASN